MLKRLTLVSLLVVTPFIQCSWKDTVINYAPAVGKYLFAGFAVSFMGWQWFAHKKQNEIFNTKIDLLTRCQFNKAEYEELCVRVLQRSLASIIEDKLKESPEGMNETRRPNLIDDLSIILRKEEEYRKIDSDLTYLWGFVFGRRAIQEHIESTSEATNPRPHLFPTTNLSYMIKNMILRKIKTDIDDVDDEVIIRKKVTD